VRQCFQYLKKLFTIDGFYLDVFGPSLHTLKNIVTVSEGSRFGTDAVEPVPDERTLSLFLGDSKETSKVIDFCEERAKGGGININCTTK